MDVYEEIVAVFSVWLVLMSVMGFYAVRILMMLHRQRRAERAYRMELALTMGRAMRKHAAGADGGQV